MISRRPRPPGRRVWPSLGVAALIATGLGCSGAGEVFSMLGHEMSYHPRTGHPIILIGANLTDSGMLQICLATEDPRQDKGGNRASREYSLEIRPDELLAPTRDRSLQTLSLEGRDEVVWKRGEQSCSEWNRKKRESVETGWQEIRASSVVVLSDEDIRQGRFRPPNTDERAIVYKVEAPVGESKLFFYGRATVGGPQRRIVLSLDGRHVDEIF